MLSAVAFNILPEILSRLFDFETSIDSRRCVCHTVTSDLTAQNILRAFTRYCKTKTVMTSLWWKDCVEAL